MLNRHVFLLLGTSLALSACTQSTIDRLAQVGNPPPMEKVDNPSKPPINWPMPAKQPEPPRSINSLWQPGSRTFFRDQRARHVGDILRVKVKISDKAKFDNKTERKRINKDSLGGTTNVYGLTGWLTDPLPGTAKPSALLSVDSKLDGSGEGKIDRKEDIDTEMAAVITQTLPNGNLVIRGSQEMRVNYELRQLTVEGIIRPEDISSENIVDSTQIAEARISYGGRGQVMDVQQPRIGNQVIDILSPF